jgi:phenylalanyl-tRNA synthetase beta subunit
VAPARAFTTGHDAGTAGSQVGADGVVDGEPAGIVGELLLSVIVAHGVEVSAAAFEFCLDALAD